MENKKGSFGILLAFFILVGLLLGAGFLIVIGSAVIDLTFDTIVPEIEDIGQIGSANMTEIAQYSIVPLNSVIQSFTWLGGLAYMVALFGLIGLSVAYRTTLNKVFIGIFIAFAVLLIMGSMFMSNIYEDFYDDTGDLGDRLKEQVILSNLILYSPMVFTILIFTCGIILFSGIKEGEFV